MILSDLSGATTKRKQTLGVDIGPRKLTYIAPEYAYARANPKLDAIAHPPHKLRP